MDEIERKILENLFDALDRLFDHESKVIDIHALIYATSNTGFNSIESLELNGFEVELLDVIQTGASEEEQREKALQITNKLRVALNELLPI